MIHEEIITRDPQAEWADLGFATMGSIIMEVGFILTFFHCTIFKPSKRDEISRWQEDGHLMKPPSRR